MAVSNTEKALTELMDYTNRCFELMTGGEDIEKLVIHMETAEFLIDYITKREKPVKPTVGCVTEYDGIQTKWYRCGGCGTPVTKPDKYCHMCGRAMDWE